MKTVSPVIKGLEQFEFQFGADQPQYETLHALVGNPDSGVAVVSRWEMTPEERLAVMMGADIYTVQLTYGHAFHPMSVQVGSPDDNANEFAARFGIGEILSEKNVASILDKLR